MSYMSGRLQRKLGLAAPLPAKKERKPIAKVSKKKQEEMRVEKEGRNGAETGLQKWYAEIMKKEEPICWETGHKINKNDKFAWQGSIAHVLSKKLFPSVATHPHNYLILEMYGGAHGQYDSSWKNAQRMKVWKIALERFIMIEPDIALGERKYIPDCLMNELIKRNPFPEHILNTDYK